MHRATTKKALQSLKENRKKAIQRIKITNGEKHAIYLNSEQLDFLKNINYPDCPKNQLISRGIEVVAEKIKNINQEELINYPKNHKIDKPNKYDFYSKKITLKRENYILFSSIGEEIKKKRKIKTKHAFSLAIRVAIDFYKKTGKTT